MQFQMRQRPPGLRQRTRPAVGASPLGPYRSRGDLIRAAGLTLAAAVFLAISGAFGSGEAPLAVRLGYWTGVMAAGAVWGGFVAGFFFRPDRPRPGLVWRIPAAALVMALPFSGVVAGVGRLAFGVAFPLTAAPALFASVFAVALAMTALNVLIAERRAPAETAPAAPRFLERLPLRLRGGELWAVEAEDHYLRLHTSRGQDLILLRLADAVAELQGADGDQVHRSWWVARGAVASVRRADGRAVLTLRDGTEVPVSRAHAARLRRQGWF